jgi:hypothetical protein
MMMRALKVFNYDNRPVAAGAIFEPASTGDANVLALAGLAEYVDDDPPKKKSKYKHREMRAEDE